MGTTWWGNVFTCGVHVQIQKESYLGELGWFCRVSGACPERRGGRVVVVVVVVVQVQVVRWWWWWSAGRQRDTLQALLAGRTNGRKGTLSREHA